VQSIFFISNQKNFDDEETLNVIEYENEILLDPGELIISDVKLDQIASNSFRKDSDFVIILIKLSKFIIIQTK
jgi:hypothetical protein